MTESVESIPLQVAPMPMGMDADTAQYVGVLEGTIAALCINEAKYRAYLELLTGDPWEETRIDIDGNVLMGLAVSALVKQTGMDIARAKVLVTKRWNERNLPKEQVVPMAVNPEPFTAGEPVNHSPENESKRTGSERYRAWKMRQLAAAQESGTDVPESENGTSVPEKSGTDVLEK